MDILEKIESLPPQAREFFESNEVRLSLERAAFAYELPQEKFPILADIVGDAFLSILPLEQLPGALSQKAGLDGATANGVSVLLLQKIFLPFPEVFKNVAAIASGFLTTALPPKRGESEVQKQLEAREPWLLQKAPQITIQKKSAGMSEMVKNERLSLLPALSKYPRLGDQNITTERIKLRSQAEPARGSLSSWIKYYRDELGIGFHDQVLRGRFLFQSENGKRLSSEERERLNLILKSIEEDFPLEIDTEKQVINFPTASPRPLEMSERPTAPLSREAVSRPAFPTPGPSTPRAFIPSAPTPSFIGKKPSVPPSGFAAPGSNQGGILEIKRHRDVPDMPKSIMSEFGGGTPGKNIAGETLHFSTGHVLPAEHETPPVSGAPAAPSPVPAIPPVIKKVPPSLPRSPYSIRPLRFRNDREEEKGS